MARRPLRPSLAPHRPWPGSPARRPSIPAPRAWLVAPAREIGTRAAPSPPSSSLGIHSTWTFLSRCPPGEDEQDSPYMRRTRKSSASRAEHAPMDRALDGWLGTRAAAADAATGEVGGDERLTTGAGVHVAADHVASIDRGRGRRKRGQRREAPLAICGSGPLFFTSARAGPESSRCPWRGSVALRGLEHRFPR